MKAKYAVYCSLAVAIILGASFFVPAAAFSNFEAATLVLGQLVFNAGSMNGPGGGSPTANGLYSPRRPAFDSSGDMWIPDIYNNRILEFQPPFGIGEAASLVIGQTSFSGNNPNEGSSVSSAGLWNPIAIAFDQCGNLWVSDYSNNRVLGFRSPFSSGEAASAVIGQTSFTVGFSDGSAGYPTAAVLFNPLGLAFDSSGNLWVSDTMNNRVLVFPVPQIEPGCILSGTGLAADLVLGQPNFNSNNPNEGAPTASQNSLWLPLGVRIDRYGALWVADSDNNRVLEWASLPAGNNVAASLVVGQPGFITNAQATTRTGLSSPRDIAIDSCGNLTIADTNNNRVLLYDRPHVNGPPAAIVLGQTLFTNGFVNGISAGTISASGLHSPRGVQYDSAGNLWVSDSNNNRLLMFPPGVSISSCPSSNPNGSSEGNETLVTRLNATTTHQASDGTDDTVVDSAVLSGVTSSPPATGTVTFYYFSGSSCTGSSTAAGSLPVNGPGRAGGKYGWSNPVQFSTPGTYSFDAVYSGDSNNAGATSACELLTVTP